MEELSSDDRVVNKSEKLEKIVNSVGRQNLYYREYTIYSVIIAL